MLVHSKIPSLQFLWDTNRLESMEFLQELEMWDSLGGIIYYVFGNIYEISDEG